MSCVLATNRCSLSLSRTTPHDPLLCSCHEHKPVGKITNLVVKNLLSWVIKVFTVEQTHNHWLNYKYKKDLRRCYLWWHFFGWFIVFVHDYHILSHVGFVLILKPPFVSSPFALLFSDDNECEKFSSNNIEILLVVWTINLTTETQQNLPLSSYHERKPVGKNNIGCQEFLIHVSLSIRKLRSLVHVSNYRNKYKVFDSCFG